MAYSLSSCTARETARRVLRLGLIASTLCACAADELPRGSAGGEACCGGRGLCLPSSFLEAQTVDLFGHEDCENELLCVPDELRSQTPPARCRSSSAGGEGRCLPACLPSIQQRGDQLAVDGCAEHQRCVPCYDPITGASTQACSVAGDEPQEAPSTFPPCCRDLGRCVPQALVPAEQRSLLGRDGCGKEGTLCAPLEALVEGDQYIPASCTTLGLQTEGRCVPECLPALASQRERLGRGGCAEHQLCAPCFDPISGAPTGSCNLGADPGPTTPTVKQAACCHGLGHCLPSALLSPEEHARLGAESCSAPETMCVPDAFAAADYAPARCTIAAAGAEGRCLPDCLPQVAAQSARLSRESCPEHHACTPCIDPVSGTTTGACELGDDVGPTGVLVVFASCCEGRGRCVPDAALPASQRSQLAQNSCDRAHDLCVPLEIANDPSFLPKPCTVSALHAEGRCLSRCLPAVADRASALAQDGCAAEQACVPCYDPVTGAATGACALGTDPGASQPPVVLPACCGGLGRCTPAHWVPDAQRGNFGPDDCAAGQGSVCVAPAAALSDPDFVPARCEDAATGAEGRCLPGCLPAIAAQASFLARGACPQDHLCAPCFNPVSGERTGACDLLGDEGPTKPAVVFASCCGTSPEDATGRCVPASLLPQGAPELPRQSCTAEGSVCAPRMLVNDPDAKFPSCSSIATTRGVCVESCYLPNIAQVVSFTGSCGAGQLCVDCALLGAAVGGCEPP